MVENLLFIVHLMNEDVHKIAVWCIVVSVLAMLPVIASGIDLFTAIHANKRIGSFKTTSYGLRKTLKKDMYYMILFFMSAVLDACLSFFLSMPILCIAVAFAEVAIEWISVQENLQKGKDGIRDPVEVAKAFLAAYGSDESKRLLDIADKLKKGEVNGTGVKENSETR